jgi:tRNA (guanine-N7-)-methyltransferase
MAQLQPDWNFLGLEIRQPLVERANQLRTQRHLTNLHYLFGNVNTTLRSLLCPSRPPPNCEPRTTNREPSSLSLQTVTIQFPDPWFKRRHQKRRVVQPQLIQDLANCLQRGGILFIQSDILGVATEMRDRILAHPDFRIEGDPNTWLSENPFPVATERENYVLQQGKPVYRCQFQKRTAL